MGRVDGYLPTLCDARRKSRLSALMLLDSVNLNIFRKALNGVIVDLCVSQVRAGKFGIPVLQTTNDHPVTYILDPYASQYPLPVTIV